MEMGSAQVQVFFDTSESEMHSANDGRKYRVVEAVAVIYRGKLQITYWGKRQYVAGGEASARVIYGFTPSDKMRALIRLAVAKGVEQLLYFVKDI